ncbi:MarR family transcriptional regulator [Ectobacillus antri]|jgi:DNA-binding MarR family transcriptional regulator|uniref:MarR family transcriptional regulator n=1 Tax=Ectobacillus antri TaxID=2486280 RepID=A0ABT6H7J4_9BACI|nr:MarR family transcriptional regulator [Ectobacillus antri]MDG4658184.1 MarR family transcriptional regulator [Ectobacillus antri]MDG5755296.1 MarR family transcriptional regulator [Ectobacillus antri]
MNYELRESLGFIINSAGRAMSNRLVHNIKQAGVDLTFEQWTVLNVLWDRDGRPQTDLACMTDRDQPSTSRIVDNLMKRGLVCRKADAKDRRVKLIYLTEEGKALKSAAVTEAQRTIEEASEGISPASVELCKEVLRKIAANLQ